MSDEAVVCSGTIQVAPTPEQAIRTVDGLLEVVGNIGRDWTDEQREEFCGRVPWCRNCGTKNEFLGPQGCYCMRDD